MEKEHRLSKSKVIDDLPFACSDELAAVEFFEKRRWKYFLQQPRFCLQCHPKLA